jgi:CDP-2,3-bis-(O-geranylgeranyl)-sn-glycerol synthase
MSLGELARTTYRINSLAMQFLIVFQLLLLLTVANGTPVIAKKLLGDRFSYPLDCGVNFIDGRPLLGSSKTVRGIGLSIAVTALLASLIGLDLRIGAMVGMTAMIGDLFSSFLKRRMKLPASSKALGLDQVPESLFPLLACRNAFSLTAIEIAATVALFFVGELLLSRILYRLGIRDHPY